MASELMRTSIYREHADFKETYDFLLDELKLFGSYLNATQLEVENADLITLLHQIKKEEKESGLSPRGDPSDLNTLVIVVKVLERYEKLGDEITPDDKLNILAEELAREPTRAIKITAEVFRYFNAYRKMDDEAWHLGWYLSEPGKRIIHLAREQLFIEVDQLPTKEKHQLLTEMQHTPLFNHVSHLDKSGSFMYFRYREDGVAQKIRERIAALDLEKTAPSVNKLF